MCKKVAHFASLALAIASMNAYAIAVKPNKVGITEPGVYEIPFTVIETSGEPIDAEIRIFKSLSDPIEKGVLLDSVFINGNGQKHTTYDLEFKNNGEYLLCGLHRKESQYLRSCSRIVVGQ